MRNMTKKWLIAAACLMAAGLILLTGASAASAWDFSRFSTVKYEMNTYAPRGNFDSISIDVDTAKIELVPSDDGKCRVDCYEAEKVKLSAAVENGTLVIKTVDTRKWYEHIGIFVGTAPRMTVYLPQEAYASLSIDTATGDVTIPKDFTFENIKIRGNTADIECLAPVSHVVEMRTDTGDIMINDLYAGELHLASNTGSIHVNSVISRGIVDVETDTGYVKLTDVDCAELTAESDTGTITLTNVVALGRFLIENDTGDVRFDNSDAAKISVETDTGDVTGTLLSEKVFITKSNTGRVDVPKSITGGRCEITTETGDIRIETLNKSP